MNPDRVHDGNQQPWFQREDLIVARQRAGLSTGFSRAIRGHSIEGASASGATIGSGVVMLFDDRVDLRDITLRIASFFRHESCGQCVPCRIGTVRQEEALHRLAASSASREQDVALIDDLALAMRDASICGLGQTASTAVQSAIRKLQVFR